MPARKVATRRGRARRPAERGDGIEASLDERSREILAEIERERAERAAARGPDGQESPFARGPAAEPRESHVSGAAAAPGACGRARPAVVRRDRPRHPEPSCAARATRPRVPAPAADMAHAPASPVSGPLTSCAAARARSPRLARGAGRRLRARRGCRPRPRAFRVVAVTKGFPLEVVRSAVVPGCAASARTASRRPSPRSRPRPAPNGTWSATCSRTRRVAAVGAFAWIHSVDSLVPPAPDRRHRARRGRRRRRSCCRSTSVARPRSPDSTPSGSPQGLRLGGRADRSAARACGARVRGLMTIAPCRRRRRPRRVPSSAGCASCAIGSSGVGHRAAGALDGHDRRLRRPQSRRGPPSSGSAPRCSGRVRA